MYLDHFGLSEPPFRITPHTDFFFEGGGRGAMLEALRYALLNEEGIVTVTGEVGSGKTMLCRVLMERMPPEVDNVFIATPSIGRDEILYTIAEELKLDAASDGARRLLRALHERLIELYGAGRRVVVLIDEAHAMPAETLEQVRLLSNLESSRHKLLQMVLFGQPELDETLARPALRPLRDRVTHSFRLQPLPEAEVGEYLTFRMRAAGYRGPDVFMPDARRLIARASGGLTRRVNILSDKSLLAAFAHGRHAVTAREARAAIADTPRGQTRLRRPALVGAALVLAAGVALGVMGQRALLLPAANGPAPATAPGQAPAPSKTAPAPSGTAPAPTGTAPAPSGTAPARWALSRGQLERVAGYAHDGQALLGARIAATVARLEREPGSSLAIELFFTARSDPARIERFLVRARRMMSLPELYVLPVARGSRYYIRVVYGAYPTRAAAIAAERTLPPKYQRPGGPRLRTYAELRRAL